MKNLISLVAVLVIFHTCRLEDNKMTSNSTSINEKIHCNEFGCEGTYQGAEFINGKDVAHQFSNKMSREIGNKMKDLYRSHYYVIVDFEAIEMSTKGMGSGSVIYNLTIPFKQVRNKCEAFTSFDHVGGWNHKPALSRRKLELKDVTLPDHELYVSELKTTREGLQEYWIQWKNKLVQKECIDIKK